MTQQERFKARFGIGVTRASVRMGRRHDYVGRMLKSRGTCRVETLAAVQKSLRCPVADLMEIVLDGWTEGDTDGVV